MPRGSHALLTKHERLLRLEKATVERKIELSEKQTRMLERFSPEFRERHIEAPHTGSLVAINHRTTPVKRKQSNGIVERLHRTLLDEHFRVEGRRTWFEITDEMQAVLDDYFSSATISGDHTARAAA